jgi:hypothetical protein
MVYFPLFGEDMFFSFKTLPFLKRQFRLNRLSSSPDLAPCTGTEDTTLIIIGTEDGNIYFILIKNGSAALSLLNKVCNSI